MDPDYNQMIPLTAKGRYGLKVAQAERFLVKLVGTLQSFTAVQLTDHFLGPLIAKTNSSILSYMIPDFARIAVILTILVPYAEAITRKEQSGA